jgi:hypothetical protein
MLGILAHRGVWTDRRQHNTLDSIEMALREGFGVETDVRDDRGRLVVAHDVPRGDEPDFTDVIVRFQRLGPHLPLAVNVKADGLEHLISAAFAGSGLDAWYLFDMSVPTFRVLARHGLPVFTRHSDLEHPPHGYASASGVWLDSFETDWFAPDTVRAHLEAGKTVCVVSPELHGRPHELSWRRLREVAASAGPRLQLCTDRPHEARAYFHG